MYGHLIENILLDKKLSSKINAIVIELISFLFFSSK